MVQMFQWVVMMLKIIFIDLILSVKRMFKLVGLVILPVGWWWLEASWVQRINLSRVLFINLSIFSVRMQVLIRIIEALPVIVNISIFHD
jgi:hypothetical protein